MITLKKGHLIGGFYKKCETKAKVTREPSD